MKPISLLAASSVALALAVYPALASAAPLDVPSQGQPSELPSLRVDELTGEMVINDKGEEIGDIDSIVRNKVSKKLFAIVGVGGFLGIGEHNVAIPLESLSLHGDRVLAPAGTTKELLKNMPEYDERQYDELPGDQVVTIGAHTSTHGGSR